jgi:hypothetical protein
MPRTRKEAKHPAIRVDSIVDKMNEDPLDTAELLPGWETLNATQQKFLAVLSAFDTKKEAAEYIGKTGLWVEQQQRRWPDFKTAVTTMKAAPEILGKLAMLRLIGKAHVALEDLLTKTDGKYTAPLSTVLAAAQHVQKATKVVEDTPQIANANFIKTDKITMFGKGGD